MSLDDWHEQDLLVEIVMMKINTHQNIVSYIDTYKDDRNYIWVSFFAMHSFSYRCLRGLGLARW